MSDPLVVRLAATDHRLAAAEAQAADVGARQAEGEMELAALTDQLETLVARTGAAAPAPAPAPAAEGLPVPAPPSAPAVVADPVDRYLHTSETFARGLRDDRAYLAEHGVLSVAWEDLLDAATLAEIDARLNRPVRAEAMTRADLLTVSVSAALGILAVLLDDDIDDVVRDRLCDLHDPASVFGQSSLGEAIRQWDRDGKRLAIDYTGPGIGGWDGVHRVRSSGHDLLRPFSALRQIREGVFTGHNWQDSVLIPVRADRPRPGCMPYRQVEELFGENGALLLWFKHLAADFTTERSLPLPGATFLHEIPIHEIRSLSGEAYTNGLNLRRVAVSGALPVATVELGLRASVFVRTWQETGSCRLSPQRTAKLENMLLLTHGLVAAASAGKVAVRWGKHGPAALRHGNPAAIAAAARYAIPVAARLARNTNPSRVHDRNQRELAAGWDALATAWEFDAAVQAYERTPAASSLTF